MLPKEIIHQINKIQLKAGHMASEALAGEYLSAFKGQGMEFDEVREYVPGDDVRTIDWNVTARMQQPFIKVFREEREMTLMLMVDVSRSQDFGTGKRLKREVACELVAVLAFLAIRNNDKVGLIIFSDHVEKFIPAKKGRGHVWRLIKEVLTYRGQGQQTDIRSALEFMLRVTKRRSLCFLISDFFADDYNQTMRSAARRHDLVAVRVEDRWESRLPGAGLVRLVDRETGESLWVNLQDSHYREAYAKYTANQQGLFSKGLRQGRIDFFTVQTTDQVVDPLIGYLRSREKHKRRRG